MGSCRSGGTGEHAGHGTKMGDGVVGAYLLGPRGVTGRRLRVAAHRGESRSVDEGGGEAMRPAARLGMGDAVPDPRVGLMTVADEP